MHSIALDVGNFTTIHKWSHEDQPVRKSSVIALVTGQYIPAVSEGSVLIEIDDGPSYLIGDQAWGYNPMELVNLNKLEKSWYLPMLLSCLGPVFEGKRAQSVYDVKLQWSLPRTDIFTQESRAAGMTVGEFLKAHLEDRFTYTYTDHRGSFNMTVDIQPEDPRQEGMDALIQARESGLLPNDRAVASVDIGGKTVEINVINEQGLQFHESYSGTGTLRGVYDIAEYIQNLKDLRNALNNNDPNIGLIMSSLAAEGEKRFKYPLDSGEYFDFKPYMAQRLQMYMSRIAAEIETKFAPRTTSRKIYTYLLVGGGAHFYKKIYKASKEVVIHDRPEFANVIALDHLNQTSNKVLAEV